MLMWREIKEKYFDLGLNETKESDYYIVGLIIGKKIPVYILYIYCIYIYCIYTYIL